MVLRESVQWYVEGRKAYRDYDSPYSIAHDWKFGPKRIPELGKSMGEALSSFRAATREAQSDFSLTLAEESAQRSKGTESTVTTEVSEPAAPAA